MSSYKKEVKLSTVSSFIIIKKKDLFLFGLEVLEQLMLTEAFYREFETEN